MVLGIRGIEESSVYQGILAKGKADGRLKEARELLIFLGRKRLGPPDERALAEIADLNDVDRLRGLSARSSDVASWDELFASPHP